MSVRAVESESERKIIASLWSTYIAKRFKRDQEKESTRSFPAWWNDEGWKKFVSERFPPYEERLGE